LDIVALSIGPWAEITPTGLRQNYSLAELGEDDAWRAWAAMGPTVVGNFNGALWVLADWIEAGETRFGEKYAQALDFTRLSYSRLANVTWVGRRFPYDRRHPGLSFTHHEKVAALTPDTADALLTVAEQHGLSANEMIDAVRTPRGSSGSISPVVHVEYAIAAVDQALRKMSSAMEGPGDHLTNALAHLMKARDLLQRRDP